MAKTKARAALKKVSTRNPVAQNPLLGKSEIHQKSGKSLRRASKMKMQKEWYPQSTDDSNCVLPISLLFTLNTRDHAQQHRRAELA